MLSIFKPGLIKNRPDARTGEKVAQFFSFLPFAQVECLDLGVCIKNVAEDFQEEAEKSKGVQKVFSNDDIVKYLKKKK